MINIYNLVIGRTYKHLHTNIHFYVTDMHESFIGALVHYAKHKCVLPEVINLTYLSHEQPWEEVTEIPQLLIDSIKTPTL